ncbi:histone deacetylase [Pseudohoeflea sp. DP4N28-3]|uniref:Histone deacetylase n=2 Tax=Pseudohoeflea coraliihabitans TaxID=2860393 RepID=A0ABS6WNB7_9HYPH|nr:histone deacetylase [Pseudohoeflea sp. DP4N28-3]
MGKYSHIRTLILDRGLAQPETLLEPVAAPRSWLELAHAPRYVDQVLSCTVPASIAREIGFEVTEQVARRARLASAGTVLAARLAMDCGVACNAAGGSHHARYDSGAGFCVFNDVAVAARLLLAEGMVSRVLVIDLDVHQGDGTALLCADEPRIRTVSMHAERNYPARKQLSSLDFDLPDGLGDSAYLDVLGRVLPQTLAGFEPDIVFYNAGVDPHASDRLGRLCLSDHGLRQRDHAVFAFYRQRQIPVVSVMGGGYGFDAMAVAERHLITFEVAAEFT